MYVYYIYAYVYIYIYLNIYSQPWLQKEVKTPLFTN